MRARLGKVQADLSQLELELQMAPHKSRSEQFVKRQSVDFLKRIFEQYAVSTLNNGKERRVLRKDGFMEATAAMNICHSSDDLELLINGEDLECKNEIDIDGFLRAIAKPTKLEQWTATLPIHQLLASCLPIALDHKDPLRQLGTLKEEEINASIEDFTHGIKTLFNTALAELRISLQELDKKDESSNTSSVKFEVFDMNAGTVENFYSGLSGRIGAPHLNLEKAVESEHCLKGGSDREFVTSNYGVKTTPRKEYQISTSQIICPQDDMWDKDKKKILRKIQRIEDLVKLNLVKMAELIEVEVLEIVLYTGPMFQVYNSVLRQFPLEEYNYYKEQKNLFSTSIHVLVSGVLKIARKMQLQPGLRLYRGLGGTLKLPDSFWKANAQGCRGYMEWGFLSTTADKSVAMHYSGVREGKPLPIVLCLRVGSVDRGANISELSQYPQEVEYLWVPCSYLEPQGQPSLELVKDSQGHILGVARVIEVRANANLRALTVEELRMQKKTIHLTAFRYMLDEMTRDLAAGADAAGAAQVAIAEYSPSLQELLLKLVAECDASYERHEKVEDYSDDQVYSGLVVEMLDVKRRIGDKMFEYMCAAVDNVATVQLLIEAKGYVHATGQDKRCCLHHAAGKGHPDCVQLLIDNKADVNAVDLRGRCSVHFAAEEGHQECVAVLIRNKADVNATDEARISELDINIQILYAAMRRIREPVIGLLQALDVNGATPFYLAAAHGREVCVRALIELNADVSAAEKVVTVNSDGSVVACFGSAGTAPGEFDSPAGIAVDGQGRIVVADCSNHRIQVLNADGSVAHCFGSEGSAPGQLKGPLGVAVDREGRVVVADTQNHRIQVLTPDGTVVRCLGSKGEGVGQLQCPVDVAVDGSGRVVATDCDNHRVQVFNEDGSVALCFGSKGDEPGEFNEPKGVAVDRDGRMFVADCWNHRIQMFDSDGRLLRVIGGEGTGVGQLKNPTSVVVDGDGRVLVTEMAFDEGKTRVQVF